MADVEAMPDGDELYAIVDGDGNAAYLMLLSEKDKTTYTRDHKAWHRVRETFFERIENSPQLVDQEVDAGFVEYFDKFNVSGKSVPFYDYESGPVTAAAPEECPPATVDIEINLKNRLKAIRAADYGPLDPKQSNIPFWQEKADLWSTSIEEAKKSLCSNCVFFVIKKSMLDCIANGIEQGGSPSSSAWDAIDQAELGYCEAFDFKCAASRTCNAWVTGGPITDDSEKGE